ncbi:hypothetical protein CHUAL_000043, partial [Chamberlinius hualienensis]
PDGRHSPRIHLCDPDDLPAEIPAVGREFHPNTYPKPKSVYSTSSYSASVGGKANVYSPTPAVVPVQYQPIPFKVKSAYEGKPY